ncbi:MAG: hypothetical protein IPM54_06335 [Polyangiaceae bacterium]|nr:hypothetical protein [Polyangiaceae bacterium]
MSIVEPFPLEDVTGPVSDVELEKKEEVAPPPMIGPLAKVGMPVEASTDAAEPSKSGLEVETALAGEEEDDRDVVELSLEQTATIAAELAEGHIEREQVFETHGLTEHAWTKNEERWETAIDEEQAHGKNTLRTTYDAAYVKRVEGFRGTITANDYAKVVVGMERGREEAVLNALNIQQEALLPIMRIWARKLARDMGLAKDVAKLLRGARAA